MCASDLWGFVRQFKLFELGDSIPKLNRMIFGNIKTRTMLTSLPEYDFEYTFNKVACIQDYDELYFMFQSHNYPEHEEFNH